MLFKADYDENGKKILCEMNGINSDMLMDIYVKKLKKDESLEILEENNECAVLLLSGDVNFNIANGKIKLNIKSTSFVASARTKIFDLSAKKPTKAIKYRITT